MMNTELTKREVFAEVSEAKPAIKEPPLYRVVMHNDDFTPMEFVVEILELFFGMEREQAITIMFEIHTLGKAICGIYSKDVAETKIIQVTEYARNHDHPLLCSVEAV
jgi:ATP-dependent Clp protease adaptor protein ClpS